MEALIIGGILRGVQGLIAAAPTLLVGLWIAAICRYFFREEGTRRLFGGESLRSLPQSWLIGMLLPVCSIGVIPILREMRRMGVRPGAVSAFALAAPLFNPLSLLYGLTLSRPIVILGFAFASLLIVTILGLIWDRYGVDRQAESRDRMQSEGGPIGIRRLVACFVFMARELVGPTGGLMLLAMLGLVVLGMLFPHGALQTSVEQDDPWAPLTMAAVAVPIYATPMMAMSQLGMMFAHANSPGAAFCLLLLGTGVNLATLYFLGRSYGWRATTIWFVSLIGLVLMGAYAVNRPLIPVGVEPAGHTHAFDVYTSPFPSAVKLNVVRVREVLQGSAGLGEWIGLAGLGFLGICGLFLRSWMNQARLARLEAPSVIDYNARGMNRVVSSNVVAMTCILGLIAFSVVACYAYYPDPNEVFEEMRIARVETLTGATSGDIKHSLYWMEQWDDWSRKLEVGAAIRRFEVRPYQRMQGYLLRKKLELLEHELEHETIDQGELRKIVSELSNTSNRLKQAYEQ